MAKNVIDFSRKKKVRVGIDRTWAERRMEEVRCELLDYGFVEDEGKRLVYRPEGCTECVEAEIDVENAICRYRVKGKLECRINYGGRIYDEGSSVDICMPITFYAFPGDTESAIKYAMTMYRIKKEDIEARCRV